MSCKLNAKPFDWQAYRYVADVTRLYKLNVKIVGKNADYKRIWCVGIKWQGRH